MIRARVPVFVCGEPDRGDDAVGFAAAGELLAMAGPLAARAEVIEVGRLDAAHLLDVPEGTGCVVVDAVAGLAPGELWVRPLATLAERPPPRARNAPRSSHVLPIEGAVALATLAERPPPARSVPPSSHVLPIEGAVALATVLRGVPPAGVFVGIGGAHFELGATLSPEASAGIATAASAIADAVARLTRAGGPASAKMSSPSGRSGRECDRSRRQQ